MKPILYILASVALGAGPLDKTESGIYNPTGKRDPFRSPSTQKNRSPAAVSELERYSVDQYQLRAVLKGLGPARVLFEDPQGKTHILKEGDSIGRSRATVSRILKTEVILTERTFNYLGAESLTEKVLSLPDEEIRADVPSKTSSAPAATQLPVPPTVIPEVTR